MRFYVRSKTDGSELRMTQDIKIKSQTGKNKINKKTVSRETYVQYLP